jgi:hypothetical protein
MVNNIFLKQKICLRLSIRPAIQYKSGAAPTHLTLTGLSLTIGARDSTVIFHINIFLRVGTLKRPNPYLQVPNKKRLFEGFAFVSPMFNRGYTSLKIYFTEQHKGFSQRCTERSFILRSLCVSLCPLVKFVKWILLLVNW